VPKSRTTEFGLSLHQSSVWRQHRLGSDNHMTASITMSTTVSALRPDRWSSGGNGNIPNLVIHSSRSTSGQGSYLRFRSCRERYTHAQVLLLCFEKISTDPKTEAELHMLQSVFENMFNFGTQVEYLTTTEDELASQIERIVATFVGLNDALKNLLIVYCAGHGSLSVDFAGYVGCLFILLTG